jgi:hypothetical protein
VTDIALERRLLTEQGLDMRRREEYDAVQSYTSDRTCDRVASTFFLHIAVVDDPGDLVGTEDQVARNIERIGQSRFGSGWSYNACAFNTGRLYEGQPLTRRGTHTVNTFRRRTCPAHGGSLEAPDTSSGFNNNVNARALVLPQQVDDPVTDEQIDAAARWAAAQIRSGLAKPTARWHGHRCVTAKECPGGRAYARIPELQRLTDHYVKHGLQEEIVNAEDIRKIADLASDLAVEKLLDAKVAKEGPTVRAALRAAAKTPAGDKRLEQVVVQAVEGLVNVGVSGVTHDEIVRAVQDALRRGTDTGI